MKRCHLPITGKSVVDLIVTDKAVFAVTTEGLVLKEIVTGMSVEELRKNTGAEFSVAPDLCEYRT